MPLVFNLMRGLD